MPNLGNMFLGEFLGTWTLILLGNGVCSNVNYKKSLGYKSGWIVIAFGWGMGVFLGVCISNNIFKTGGWINPAVALAQLVSNKTDFSHFIIAIIAEFAGAIVGQIIVNIFYWQHIKENNCSSVLGSHATGPTHPKAWFTNIFSEYIGTCVLVAMALFGIASNWFGGAPLAIALVVFSIGLSLGGTTGYAINPFRDLCPRIVHYFMYKIYGKIIKQKDDIISSNWKYSWIPVLMPLAAGASIGVFALI